MQRIVPFRGGVNSYLDDPWQVAQGAFLHCLFCPDGHLLVHHGSYWRYALLSEGQDSIRICVVRLLCKRLGRTISLLPDFCIPRHQTGPTVLARFLFALVFQGLTLCGALRQARPHLSDGEIRHATAQRLRDRFSHRLPIIRAYLAGAKARFCSAPSGTAPHLRPLAAVLETLRAGHAELSAALMHHGRLLHGRCQVGLL